MLRYLLVCLIGLVVYASPSSAQGVHWTTDSVYLEMPHCGTGTMEVELLNDGVKAVTIDKIAIIGADANVLSILATNPPGRMTNFVLDPGPTGVKYHFTLDPSTPINQWISGKLVAYTSSGDNDTLIIAGFHPAEKLSVDKAIIDGGTQPILTRHSFFPAMFNTGTKDAAISKIEVESDVQTTILALAVDTIIHSMMTRVFMVEQQSDQPGAQETVIRVYGSPCDAPLVYTINTMYTGVNAVEGDAEPTARIIIDDDRFFVSSPISASWRYQLSDIAGRSIMLGSMMSADHIDISSLPHGAYALAAYSGDQVITAKFVR